MLDSTIIKQTLRTVLIDAEIIPEKDFAWESKKFNATGKCLWIRETLLPTSEIPASQNNEEFVGIYALDIFTPLASGSETMEAKAKAIGAVFDGVTVGAGIIAGDGLKIIIDRAERLAIAKDDSWQWIPVYIYFRAVN